MQFLAMIYQDEAITQGFSKEEWAQIFVEYRAASTELTEQGVLKLGYAMQAVACGKTVAVRDGAAQVQAGPAFDNEAQLSAVNLIEAVDLDAAIEAVSRFPSARWGRVEVRPLMVYKATQSSTRQG